VQTSRVTLWKSIQILTFRRGKKKKLKYIETEEAKKGEASSAKAFQRCSSSFSPAASSLSSASRIFLQKESKNIDLPSVCQCETAHFMCLFRTLLDALCSLFQALSLSPVAPLAKGFPPPLATTCRAGKAGEEGPSRESGGRRRPSSDPPKSRQISLW